MACAACGSALRVRGVIAADMSLTVDDPALTADDVRKARRPEPSGGAGETAPELGADSLRLFLAQ